MGKTEENMSKIDETMPSSLNRIATQTHIIIGKIKKNMPSAHTK
jgi:hypothetical protein